MESINFVAVLVATVANFFFGYLWYTPLFGKAWAKEQGIEIGGPPPAGALAKGLVMNFIGNFLMAFVFANNNWAWSFVPEMNQMSASFKIFNAAFFTWLGFYLPTDLNTVAWERRSWKFFFINTGYHLGMVTIAAIILILMS